MERWDFFFFFFIFDLNIFSFSNDIDEKALIFNQSKAVPEMKRRAPNPI